MQVDVAIVGAGPAGASTALHLLAARPKAKIAIVERESLPRVKPCGGAISRWGLAALEAIDATPAKLGVDHVPIQAIRVRHRDVAREQPSPDGAPMAVVVERAAFDAALAREAERRGATLLEGARVTALDVRGDRVAIETEGRGVLDCRFVVGADGTGSAVRRLSGLFEPGPRARLVVLETDEVARDDLDRGVLEFDLSCVDEGVDGYVWHFATTFGGRRCVSRGIYQFRGRDRGDARALREALERALIARGVDPRAARAKPYSERVFVSKSAPVATSRVLLAGEAAGLVDPVTGEGIAQAVVSGRTAAEAIATALDSGRLDAEAYRRALLGLRFHRHLRQAAALAPHVYGPRASRWAHALATCRPAVAAGVDWYLGAPLGIARKVRVAASYALSFLAG